MKDASIPVERRIDLPPLYELVIKWKELKLEKAKLAVRQSEVDNLILDHVGRKESGSVTKHTDTDTIKVEFKGEWNCDDWDALQAEVPKAVYDAVVRIKREVDAVPAKKLMASSDYPALKKRITRTAGSAYIQIKERAV